PSRSISTEIGGSCSPWTRSFPSKAAIESLPVTSSHPIEWSPAAHLQVGPADFFWRMPTHRLRRGERRRRGLHLCIRLPYTPHVRVSAGASRFTAGPPPVSEWCAPEYPTKPA